PARPPAGRRRGVRSPAVLRLRVRRTVRLRDPGGGDRTPPGYLAEPRGGEGAGPAPEPGRTLRARGPRPVRRVGAAGARSPRARCRRRGFGARAGGPPDRGRARARGGGA